MSSEVNELLCLHRSERYGTCDDEAETEGQMMPAVFALRISRPHRKNRRLGDGRQSRFADMGTPKSRKTFWGEEEQGSERSFRRKAETEMNGLCDDEPVNGRIEAIEVAERLSVTPHFEDLGTTHKPQKAERHPQMPHTPSESPRHFAAHRDESVIVGYYTSAEVLLRSPRPSATLGRKEKSYGKKRWN